MKKKLSVLNIIDKDSTNASGHGEISPENLRNVSNPYSVHGIYPYRGKISAIDAINVISKFTPGKLLLDPFCGSGTIVYEAYRKGLDVIGVDYNPLAIILTKGKMSLSIKGKKTVIQEVNTIIEKAKHVSKPKRIPSVAKKGFHPKTAEQIMRLTEFYEEMSDYLKAVFCGSICVAARGCNHYFWTSTTVGKDIHPKRNIDFYEKFNMKVKKHFFPLENGNRTKIYQKDARKLSRYIPKKSVDYIFTSPPYFDGLDYTAYYAKFVFPILEMDRLEVKKDLIQTTKTYEKDMTKVLSEVEKVTKNDALIVFVVGDKKIGNKIINGGEYFSKLLHHEPTKIIERNYSSSASQVFDKLNKTKRKEQIVIWDKSTW